MLPGDMASPFGGQSWQARAIGDLFTQTLVICGVIFVIVAGLVVTCILRFRARAGAAEPKQTHGNTRLEIVWTVVPVAIVISLFALTARTMASADPEPNRAPDLKIVGHQWWWEVQYASGTVTANEIHIPVGKDILVELSSADVIHDFWVPALGRKIDANPGKPNHFWISADKPGVYDGACAEYCGSQHAWMRIRVIADAEKDFQAWEGANFAAAQALPEAARGAALFRSLTCVQCHAIKGVTPPLSVAPDLTHLAGRTTLAAGLLENNPANLAAWLKDPQALKPASHMPTFKLTDEQVADLVTYFETLK